MSDDDGGRGGAEGIEAGRSIKATCVEGRQKFVILRSTSPIP